MLTIGLVVNPLAGVGGPAAMKGSDGPAAQARADELGVLPQAHDRARAAFTTLAEKLAHNADDADELTGNQADRAATGCRIIGPAGELGFAALTATPFDLAATEGGFTRGTAAGLATVEPLAGFSASAQGSSTSAADTRAVVAALLPLVDVLVFVGGDGTARDVLDAMLASGIEVPVLGIPAGVKMHSGVFATSPPAAGLLMYSLIDGGLVSATHAEVRDIDEAGLRRGEVGSKRYGELLVPGEGGYLQHVKSGGKEVEALVLLEIAAEVSESLGEDGAIGPLVLGPGSTCFAIKEHLLANAQVQLSPALLGVDVVYNGELLLADANARDLTLLATQHANLQVIVSFSRGQGFVLGRGNQQLTAELLSALPPAALHVVSSRTKLASLAGRPLLVDTGQPMLDEKFSGLTQIISGYQDKLLYLVQPA